MLTRKLFFILAITLISCILAYFIIKIVEPEIFNRLFFGYQPEILILIFGCFIIFVLLLLWLSLKINFLPSKSLPSKDLDQNYFIPIYTDQMLMEYLPNLLCIKDNQRKWLLADSNYLEILNLQNVNYFSKTDEELALYARIDNTELQLNIEQDKLALLVGKPIIDTRTTSLPNKESVSIEITRTPIFDHNNKAQRLVLTGKYVENPNQQTDSNKSNFELLTNIFNSSHLSFVIVNSSLKVIRINNAFSSLTGYSFEEVEDQNVAIILKSKNIDKFTKKVLSHYSSNEIQIWSRDVYCEKKDGELFIARLDIKPIKNNDHVVDKYFVTLVDKTLHKQYEKRILQIAHYDDLTGLANRVMFHDNLAKVFSAAKRYSQHVIIFFLDLDKFKSVNDSLGHDAGDEVLRETAKRLVECTRREDIVARFSGDEFAIMMLNFKTHEKAIFSASLIAKKIIESLSQIYYIHPNEIFVGASVGIAIYPEDGISSEAILKNADVAMYEAKNKGPNNYQFYKKEFAAASEDRLAIEHHLRKALDRNELQLFYQPQYEINSKKICGAEVLLRWTQFANGKNKTIPPDIFIPIAEDTGLIIEIGEWVLNTACKQLKSWINEGLPIEQVSVNISARQFMHDNFLQSIENALQKVDLDPRHLEIEITESMLIGDTKLIELHLNRLKKMGLSIALDDFGTGYSSLSYLKNFPIDVLKIDQSFVKDLSVQAKDSRIARAIIDMGHSLGQKIVAEGVENIDQLEFLGNFNCDIIQGFFFSPPLPLYKMTLLLKAEQDDEAPSTLWNQ